MFQRTFEARQVARISTQVCEWGTYQRKLTKLFLRPEVPPPDAALLLLVAMTRSPIHSRRPVFELRLPAFALSWRCPAKTVALTEGGATYFAKH